MLESLTISHFTPRVGERFTIGSGGFTVDTELIEATPVGDGRGPGGRVPFSLVFRGRADVVLPQRTYQVDHPELGRLHIFLVPIGPDATGMRYEAIFI